MNITNLSIKKITISCFLGIAINLFQSFSFFSFFGSTISLANSDKLKEKEQLNSSVLRYNPPPPPNLGTPTGRGRGGSSRSQCKPYQEITAIVPTIKNQNKDYVWALTTAAYPTFWFYLPEKLTKEITAEFVLQDSNDNLIYRTQLKELENSSGIINLNLPQSSQPLIVNREYYWTFSLYCNPQKPSTAITLKGTIKRINLEEKMISNLENIETPLEKANFYAFQGIWHDTFTLIAQLYAENPEQKEVKSAWENLLSQVDLMELVDKPIVKYDKLSIDIKAPIADDY